MKKEIDSNEESKDDMFSSDPKEKNNRKGGSCPNVNNAIKDQNVKIERAVKRKAV